MSQGTTSQEQKTTPRIKAPKQVGGVTKVVPSSSPLKTRPKGRNSTFEFHDHYPDENPDSTIDHITNVLIEIGSFQRAQEKRIASAMKRY